MQGLDWIYDDEMYPEANFHDETVPVNQEQRNKQKIVAEATKAKEQKKSQENTADEIALKLSASKDLQAQKETQKKLAKLKFN